VSPPRTGAAFYDGAKRAIRQWPNSQRLSSLVAANGTTARLLRWATAGKCYESGPVTALGLAMVKFSGLSVVAFLVTAAAIAAAWWWLGQPVALPAAAADPGRIQCLSYAPFRADQSPLVDTTHIEAWQIEEDLAKLARLTGCVRTYSIENGLDQVPAIAERLGLKVLQGLWLGSDRRKNRLQIDGTVALAKRHAGVMSGIVVGNEVLLRGELGAPEIAAVLGEVKAATGMPVTYADVWEYWLRNRDLAAAVDFVTIHILPYWEDFPIPAADAAAHVDAIRGQVAVSFPGKEILIGEVGWPSEGRMREGALPSPSNQARVLAEVMARARAGNYRVNLIEAFDQPWKRRLEGTVGGHWGLFDSEARQPKFEWGMPVSDHPLWRWQLAGGLVMAALVFAGAAMAAQDVGAPKAAARKPPTSTAAAFGLFIIGVTAGIAVPWTITEVAIESLGPGGWLRGAAFAVVAVVAPVAAAMALAAGVAVPSFAHIMGPRKDLPGTAIACLCGLVLVLATILAVQTALGLVFDPRYRDFTFAPLTAAAVPFAIASFVSVRGQGPRGVAETIAALTLSGSAVYIALSESFANWQALWFAASLVVLALTLARGYGTCKAKDEKRGCKARQSRIVEHDAKCTRHEADCEKGQGRPDQRKEGGADGDPAEHLVVEQGGNQGAAEAQPGVEPGIAGEPDTRLLNHEIPQIHGVTEREEADGDYPVERRRRRSEGPWLRGGVGAAGWRAVAGAIMIGIGCSVRHRCHSTMPLVNSRSS